MRTPAFRRGLVALVLCTAGAGCTGIEGPPDQEVAIELSATPSTVEVGATVSFHFDASGNSLAGIALSYGDGAVDSIATFLARTAAGTYFHGYDTAGSYKATVTVLEDGGRSATDSVRIEVVAANARRRSSARPAGRVVIR